MIKLFCAHAVQCVGDNVHSVKYPGLTFMFLSWLLKDGIEAKNHLSTDELDMVTSDLMWSLDRPFVPCDEKTSQAEYYVMLKLLKHQ